MSSEQITLVIIFVITVIAMVIVAWFLRLVVDAVTDHAALVNKQFYAAQLVVRKQDDGHGIDEYYPPLYDLDTEVEDGD